MGLRALHRHKTSRLADIDDAVVVRHRQVSGANDALAVSHSAALWRAGQKGGLGGWMMGGPSERTFAVEWRSAAFNSSMPAGLRGLLAHSEYYLDAAQNSSGRIARMGPQTTGEPRQYRFKEACRRCRCITEA